MTQFLKEKVLNIFKNLAEEEEENRITLEQREKIIAFMKNLTETENGETAFKSTLSKNLDFFGLINRGAEIHVLVESFISAYNENGELALKTMLNFRDARGGKGEKLIGKVLFLVLKICNVELYKKMLPFLLDVGCWKDLLFLHEMGVIYGCGGDEEVSMFAKQLGIDHANLLQNATTTTTTTTAPSLCAKWAPTENGHFDRKTGVAKKIMKAMKMDRKQYRLMLSKLREKIVLVETHLSQNRTEEIEFGKVPSRAHLLYKPAFSRDENAKKEKKAEREVLKHRYLAYLQDLREGKESANFKGVHPHELVARVNKNSNTVDALIESQWESIKKEVEEKNIFNRSVCIVDVSGSMDSGTPKAMDVAIALGILLSECAKGFFHNKVITFHESPSLVNLNDCKHLHEKVKKVHSMPWGSSTDIEKVFELLLFNMERNQQAQMPEKIFIFTDMQFNQVSGGRLKTYDKIKEKYANKGFKLPKIISWNLRTVSGVGFTKEDENVCLLSGFSTSILSAFLNNKFTPLAVYLDVVNKYKLPEGCDFASLSLSPAFSRSQIDLEKIQEAVEKSAFKVGGEEKTKEEQ